jgi:hypothetical protein
MKRNVKRYQECSWPVRLWRRRHYLGIPYRAIRYWWSSKRHTKPDDEFGPMSFGLCWSIAIGEAQIDMNWYYTGEEMREHLEERKKEWKAKKDADHLP